MKYSYAAIRPLLLVAALACLGFLLGCGGDSSDGDQSGVTFLTGKAFLPFQVDPNQAAVPNAPFQVVDFQKGPLGEVVANGIMDAEGTYAVELPVSKIVAVIVSGPFRISGLTTADINDLAGRGTLIKNFDGVTDVACQAGVTALGDGSLSPGDMTTARIRNLEAGSLLVNQTTTIDFFNPDSVTAAANLVRQITNDGSNPPQ